jgi:hypothetical protein
MKLALILPINKSDYLTNTVLDGLIDLNDGVLKIDFVTTCGYPSPFDIKKYEKKESDFIEFAKDADKILFFWGKNNTNYALAEKIGLWKKTIFIDGSELGKNNRFDLKLHNAVISGEYKGIGSIDFDLLNKCHSYYRREKPYLNGIKPFPFGIERRYRNDFSENKIRDIDFTCIFGQDEFPSLRKEARDYLEKFCKRNSFSYHTRKTNGFSFFNTNKNAGREEFYDILSRSKVGISIGGGGYDTARFWEVLGSGAVLLTEKIDIYNNDSRLKYDRIFQFEPNLDDFKIQLDIVAKYIRSDYETDLGKLNTEYAKVISEHSTAARVKEILNLYNE